MAVRVSKDDEKKGKSLLGLSLPYGREQQFRRFQKDMQKNPDRPSEYNQMGAPGSFPGEFGNFLLDDARDTANAVSNFLSWVSGQPSMRAGDHMYGMRPRPGGAPRGAREGARLGIAGSRAIPDSSGEEQGDPWARYLKMAEQYMGPTRDWDALERALRDNHGRNDAQLQAMYRALQGEIAESGERIGAIYDEGAEKTNATGDQVSGLIQNAHELNRQRGDATRAALGIEDAAAVTAHERAYDLPDAVGGVEANRQSALNHLIANQAAGRAMNERTGQGARFGEASRRSDLLNYLTTSLGDLAFARSDEAAQRQRALIEMAMGLRNSEEGGGDWRQHQALAELGLKREQMERTSSRDQAAQSRLLFETIMRLADSDPVRAQEIMNIYQSGFSQ